jgi:hypothetical protein
MHHLSLTCFPCFVQTQYNCDDATKELSGTRQAGLKKHVKAHKHILKNIF